MAENTPQTYRKPDSKMPYAERLANYEREKAEIPRVIRDYKTYETMVRMLAKKWRV